MPSPPPIQVRLKTERVRAVGAPKVLPGRTIAQRWSCREIPWGRPRYRISQMLEMWCYSDICACTAVMATTPTMSSAEQPRERSFTGLAMPCRMGP